MGTAGDHPSDPANIAASPLIPGPSGRAESVSHLRIEASSTRGPHDCTRIDSIY